MKIEKWTLGLAAIGLVTLAPALHAQTPPPQLVPVQTAVTATTISGYVDTSAVWNPGTGNANPAPYAFNQGKQDGFNIDVVDLKVSKPLDETQWSAGYTLELNYGPDARIMDGGSESYPIRQAFVALRVPVGNGLDFDLGRWDSLLGYEYSDAMNNVNWSHTYGKTMEPTENTGLLASYKFCDEIKLQVGVANTIYTAGLNDRNDGGTIGDPSSGFYNTIESKKSVVSLLTLTAPDSWGFLKGSTLSGGFDIGQGYTDTGARIGSDYGEPYFPYDHKTGYYPAHNRSEWYVGTTLMTPVTGLTFGAAYDGIEHLDVPYTYGYGDPTVDSGYFQSYAAYISYKATDKLTISGRFEYAAGSALGLIADGQDYYTESGGETYYDYYSPLTKVFDLTGTVQYDLWANVITRVEVRWDHEADGGDYTKGAFGGSLGNDGYPDKKNEVMVAANVIYKF